MEPVETPYTEDINLTSENSKPKKKEFDVQQYFLDPENNEENNDKIDQTKIIIKDKNKCCGISCLIFLIIIMFSLSLLLIILFLKAGNIQFIILSFVIIIFFIFFIIVILITFGTKYVFSKNSQNNKFYIKRLNLLNIPIINFELSLGNYYIKCIKDESIDTDGLSRIRYYIYLYNQMTDISEINLDTTNIKEVPIKLIYIFEISLSGLNAEKQLEDRLNNFICAKNFKDPFLFNINAYMNKQVQPFFYQKQTKYIKYSDYFFTFLFKCFGKTIDDINGVIRIDFIYSENFDRIFIGIVKRDEKSYAKTFEFKMDSIDKFILQRFKNFNGFDLKVIFKDKQIQVIWPIEKKTQEELEGLVYLLNERLNDN